MKRFALTIHIYKICMIMVCKNMVTPVTFVSDPSIVDVAVEQITGRSQARKIMMTGIMAETSNM